MKTILFIRHGATAGTLERRYLGRTDESLCPEGIAQMQALKQTNLTADRLYTSPAQRTRQSAAILFPHLTPHCIPAFWETDFGPFEGHTADELVTDPAYRAWLDTNCQGPIPGGEDIAAFKTRCQQAFAALIPDLPDNTTTAFLLHGGVIMAILEAYASPKRGFYDWYHKAGEGSRWGVEAGGMLTPLPPASPHGQFHNPPHTSPAG